MWQIAIFFLHLVLRINSTESNHIWLVRHVEKSKLHNYYHVDWPEENYKWPISAINGEKNAKEIASFFQEIYSPNNDSEVTEDTQPLIYASPFLRTLETAIPIAKALKTKIRIEYGLFEHIHGIPTKKEINEFISNQEIYIDSDYSTPDYIIETIKELKLHKFCERTACMKAISNIFVEIMGTYIRNQQEEEKRDIIVVTHQEQVYGIGNSLLKNTESNIEEYIVHHSEVQSTSTESIESEKLEIYKQGTILKIIKIITNPTEYRIRGQIKDSLNWVSIQNLDNGYFWMKPKTKPWIKDTHIKCGSICHFQKDMNRYKFQKHINKFDKNKKEFSPKYIVRVKEIPETQEEENALLETSNVILEEESSSNTISCQETFEELCSSCRKDFLSKNETPETCLQKFCKKFLCCITKN